MHEKVDKWITSAPVRFGRSGEIIVGVEPRIGLAALGCSMEQVMSEGVHPSGSDVWITLEIKSGVEEFFA